MAVASTEIIGDQADDPGGAVASVQVAGDHTGEHQPRAAADRLQCPPGGERFDRRRADAQQRRHRVDGETGEDDAAAAEPVRQRAVEKLREGEGGDVEADRELGHRRGGVEGRRKPRQRRQEDVEGERVGHAEEDEECGQPRAVRRLEHEFHGIGARFPKRQFGRYGAGRTSWFRETMSMDFRESGNPRIEQRSSRSGATCSTCDSGWPACNAPVPCILRLPAAGAFL